MVDGRGELFTAPSLSICAAKEMVAIGVLNSCVILLMKSFLIADNFFCLTMTTIQNPKHNTNKMVMIKLGNNKTTEDNRSCD